MYAYAYMYNKLDNTSYYYTYIYIHIRDHTSTCWLSHMSASMGQPEEMK